MNLETYQTWTHRRIEALREAFPAPKFEALASVLDLVAEEFGLVGKRHVKAAPREVRRGPHHDPWIQGIYAIGSAGTVSATAESDVDLWLVVDGRAEGEREALRRAGRHLETWAAERGLDLRIFVHEAAEVAAGRFGEDTEGAQAFGPVLAEEFFRTGLWLGGRPPAWWVDPAPGGAAADRPLDLGAPSPAAPEVYLAAALLQVEKAVERPFKSMLKAAALRLSAEGRLARLPAETVRERVEDGILDRADPYVALVEAIWEAMRSERETFALVKTCLYMKGVVEEKTPARILRWRQRLEDAGFNRLGPPLDLHDLDRFTAWPLGRRLDLSRRIAGYLRATLASLAPQASAAPWARETARAIARRLEARAAGPGRIERLSLLDVPVAGDLFTVSSEDRHWAVTAGDPRHGGSTALRRAADPIEAMAFLAANDLCAVGRTRVRFVPPGGGVRRVDDLVRRVVRLASPPPRRADLLAPETPVEVLVVWLRAEIRDPSTDRAARIVRTSWGGIVHASFEGEGAIAGALGASIGGIPSEIHVDFVGPDEATLLDGFRLAVAAPRAATVVADLPRYVVLTREGADVAPSLLGVLDHIAAASPPGTLVAPPAVRALVEAIGPGPALRLVEAGGEARAVVVEETGRWHVWPAAPDDLAHLGPSLWRFLRRLGVEVPVHRLEQRRGRDDFAAVEVDTRSWGDLSEVPVVVEIDARSGLLGVSVGGVAASAPDALLAAADGIRALRAGRGAYPPRVTEIRLAGAPGPGEILAAKRTVEAAIEAAWRRGRGGG